MADIEKAETSKSFEALEKARFHLQTMKKDKDKNCRRLNSPGSWIDGAKLGELSRGLPAAIGSYSFMSC
jgi:hypothetical protein